MTMERSLGLKGVVEDRYHPVVPLQVYSYSVAKGKTEVGGENVKSCKVMAWSQKE